MYENALAIKIPPADKILPGYFRTKKLRNLNQKISDRILYYVIVDTGYAIVLGQIHNEILPIQTDHSLSFRLLHQRSL